MLGQCLGCLLPTDAYFGRAGKLVYGREPGLNAKSSNLEQSLESRKVKAARAIEPWRESRFRHMAFLNDAASNQGSVDMMEALDHGSIVAVKRVPNEWVTANHVDFIKLHPESIEQPWSDLALLGHLNALGFPFVCEFLGVYRDPLSTYIVTSLAGDGDLFMWCERAPFPGPEREAAMQPIVAETFRAVRQLHELGICHRDLSLENVLLASDADNKGPRVRLCDFGMASSQRHCCGEVRGKKPYQAPEMHLATTAYDAFRTDAFALGVLTFAMATEDYPWTSTASGECELFAFIRDEGLKQFLTERVLRKGDGQLLQEVMSEELVALLQGLLETRPEKRWNLGEGCWSITDAHVWSAKWLPSKLETENDSDCMPELELETDDEGGSSDCASSGSNGSSSDASNRMQS